MLDEFVVAAGGVGDLHDQILARVNAVHAALAAGPGPQRPDTLHEIGRRLTSAFVSQREWQLLFLDFWRRAMADDTVRAAFLSHRRALRTAIADAVRSALGPHTRPSGLNVEELVTVVLALSNGLAIEHMIDPEAVGDDLFGRILSALQEAPVR